MIVTRKIKNIERVCVVCGKQFLTSLHNIGYGKTGGTCCSFQCVGKRKHILWRQDGKFNPNYKGALAKFNHSLESDYRVLSKEQAQASAKICDAVNKGKIERQPCIVCGDPNSEGHHEDYSKPMEVIWLCDKHHKQKHNESCLGH